MITLCGSDNRCKGRKSIKKQLVEKGGNKQSPERKIFQDFVLKNINWALVRVDRNLFAVLAKTLECHDAFDQGEQGVILTASDVVARMNLGASLTINDVACLDAFAAEFFAAETLSA